ncbi:MAG: hypothetical protein ACOY3P_03550 [Planctomycetota bacterium]
MKPHDHKSVLVIPPALVDDANAAAVAIDTKGYNYARLKLQVGATDIAATALYLTESDDNSTYTNVSGTVFGTSLSIAGAASALPSSTSDNTIHVIDVDLKGRKRYLKPVLTIGNGSTGAYVSMVCDLFHGDKLPSTATEMGVTQVVRV